MIVVIVFSPLTNKNHPLEKYHIKQNKKMIYGMLVTDFVLYATCYKFNLTMASGGIVFIILVAFILMMGIVKEKVIGNVSITKNKVKRGGIKDEKNCMSFFDDDIYNNND